MTTDFCEYSSERMALHLLTSRENRQGRFLSYNLQRGSTLWEVGCRFGPGLGLLCYAVAARHLQKGDEPGVSVEAIWEGGPAYGRSKFWSETFNLLFQFSNQRPRGTIPFMLPSAKTQTVLSDREAEDLLMGGQNEVLRQPPPIRHVMGRGFIIPKHVRTRAIDRNELQDLRETWGPDEGFWIYYTPAEAVVIARAGRQIVRHSQTILWVEPEVDTSKPLMAAVDLLEVNIEEIKEVTRDGDRVLFPLLGVSIR